MYNEIRRSVGTRKSSLDKLYKHMDILAESGEETRWSLLCFACGWSQPDPVPIDVINHIEELYGKGKVKA